MTTKTLTGAYPGGYYLKPVYTTLDIAASAVVDGTGVRASSAQAATIDNYGTIASTTSGVVLLDGGSVTNAAGARIGGGVSISGQQGMMLNSGTITGDYYAVTGSGSTVGHQEASVLFAAGGEVVNAVGGYLANGVSMGGLPAAVINYGSIGDAHLAVTTGGHTVTTTYASVVLSSGGTIINGTATNATASLEDGVSIAGQGTITNFGVIGATSAGVAVTFTGFGDRLIEESGGVIDGAVAGGSGVLELAAGGGTINGLGATITGFADIEVDAGAGWHLSGANTISSGEILTNAATVFDDGVLTNTGSIELASALELSTSASLDNDAGGEITLYGTAGIFAASGAMGTSLVNAGKVDRTGGPGGSIIDTSVDNTGTVLAASGLLDVGGSVTGSGVWQIGAGGRLEFDDPMAAGGTVAFTGAGGVVQLTDAAAFAGGIAGFAGSASLAADDETVDLSSIAFGTGVTLSWSGGPSSGTLTLKSGAEVASLTFLGQYSAANFAAAADSGTGTDITFVPSSKTLTGSYGSGYALKPVYDAVTITSTGSVGGAGLVVESGAPSSVENLGTVSSVNLPIGGILQNGSLTDTTALIVSVDMANGVVINNGTIGGASTTYPGDHYGPLYPGSAVYSNGAMDLVNYGRIKAPTLASNIYLASYQATGWAAESNLGGSVANGSATDLTALMGGVSIAGGVGSVSNFGTMTYALQAAQQFGIYYNWSNGYYVEELESSELVGQYAVNQSDGGSVTNGSAKDVGATIDGGVWIGGAVGTVTNFGTIGGRVDTALGLVRSVVLDNGGVLINGSSSDRTARITLGASIVGVGTVTNFGTLGGLSMSSSADLLIEEGGGVLQTAISGGEGVLELAAAGGLGTISGLGVSITNFATIEVDSSAGWTFSGTNTIASGATFDNAAEIVIAGTLVNDSTFTPGASLELASNGTLVNSSGAEMVLSGAVGVIPVAGAVSDDLANAGLVEQSGAGTSSINTAVDNTGTIDVEQGVLTIGGAVSGDGLWRIDPVTTATLQFHDAVAAGADVAFTAAGGNLLLDDAVEFGGTIVGFGDGGETLDLRSISATGVTLAWSGGPSGGQLTVTSGSEVATLSLAGAYAPSSFHAADDGSGGTDITFIAATKTISSGHPAGYTLAAGYYLTIAPSGSIGGGGDAVGLTAGAGATVVNAGGITGGAPSGGALGNGGAAVVIASGSLNNAGVITGGAGAGGHDSPAEGGDGVDMSGGVLTNSGVIDGGASPGSGAPQNYIGVGVSVSGAGTVLNEAGSTIYGRLGVIDTSGALTVTNFGTISGLTDAVSLSGGRVIEEASGVLSGKVLAAGGATLELGAEAGTGTIAGVGTTITGFSTIIVDAGAGWHFSGVNTIKAGDTLQTASAIIIAASGKLTNDGTASLGALVQLSSGAELDNAAGGLMTVAGDVGINPAPGATGALVVNAGTLEKAAGTGLTKIGVNLTDTGAIVVASGTVDIAGAVNSIRGAVSGKGQLELDGGATTLGKGASLSVSAVEVLGSGTVLTVATNVAFAHAFTASGANTLAIDTGDTLALSSGASFTGGTIDGAGHLITKAASKVSGETLGGTAEWFNAGAVALSGKLTIGDSAGHKALFINQATGVVNMTGSVGVGTSATDEFENQGLLEWTGTTGSSVVAAKVVNSGTVEAVRGVLDLTGAVSGDGTLDIRAAATLELASTVGVGGEVVFAGTKADLILADAVVFHDQISGFGTSKTIDLRGGGFAPGATLSYSGTSASGTLTVKDGAATARIALLGQYAAANFKTSSDGSGGLDITFVATSAPVLAAPVHG